MGALVTLVTNGPMSMSDLSTRVGITPEQTTRTIRSLQEAGLMESECSTTNRRVVIARISQQGEQIMTDHQRQAIANLSAVPDGPIDNEVAHLAKRSRQASEILRKTSFRHVVSK